jgi:hypothetical protein
MVKNLPYWQSSLLAHLDSEQTVDRLEWLLESGEKLQLDLVSDYGSFGWELAVGRTIPGTCRGPTFGLHPGSYGMLSALFFLELYFRFFQVQVSDNNVEHL